MHQALKDQPILAPDSWQTICCKVLTCLEIRLGTTLHQNNYTNKMKFKLFIGSGKVRLLEPLNSLFQSQLQKKITITCKSLFLLKVTSKLTALL